MWYAGKRQSEIINFKGKIIKNQNIRINKNRKRIEKKPTKKNPDNQKTVPSFQQITRRYNKMEGKKLTKTIKGKSR